MTSPGEPERNAYEEERRHRIERNRRVLQELGLLNNPISGAAEAAQRAAAAKRRRLEAGSAAAAGSEQQPLEPQRRSRRLQGEAAENGGMAGRPSSSSGQQTDHRSSSTHKRVQLDPEALDGPDPSLDAHNVMRIRTMSERALQTRIWKIRRVDKLASFARALEACGMAELAGEAREALRLMCGGAEPE